MRRKGRKDLGLCANGDGRSIAAPSLVICQECQNAIGAKLEALAARDRVAARAEARWLMRGGGGE